MTTLDQRLQAIQKRLEEKGCRDFKFTLNPEVTPSVERVKEDVANLLEAYLDGKVTPVLESFLDERIGLTPLNDVDPPDTHPV